MRVLLLSNNWEVAEPVRAFLDEREMLRCNDKPILDGTHQAIAGVGEVDIIVSYCYRHMIGPKTLALYPAVNLHNSFLPWGRGAQPLFWSVLNDEPSGVSIHWMDEGLDTGPVIAQQRVELHEGMTFRQAYEAQHRCLAQLFVQEWTQIRNAVGSHHSLRDFDNARHVLVNGWDTTLAEAKRRYDEIR